MDIDTRLEQIDAKLDGILASLRVQASNLELVSVSVRDNGREIDNLRLSVISLKRGGNSDGKRPLLAVEE